MIRIIRIGTPHLNVAQLQRGCWRGFFSRWHRDCNYEYNHNANGRTEREIKESVQSLKENLRNAVKDFKDIYKYDLNQRYHQYNQHYRHQHRQNNQTSGLDSLIDTGFFKSPETSITQTSEAYKVRVEIPGVKKDQVQISFSKDHLIITTNQEVTSDSTTSTTTGTNNNSSSSTSKVQYKKELYFEEAVNPETITAKLEDGVLNINVPKEVKDINISIN